ncbi:Glutamate 5-kinase [Mycolicibacterium aubagnense]
MLLTAHDIAQRVQHNNAQRTLDRLRALHAVAIVNENDTVATDESGSVTTTGCRRWWRSWSVPTR